MATDEGFREIQLNGKQLVFLFMATTIVAVVIFLCGVMVGRGVRTATATTASEPAPPPPTPDAVPAAEAQPPAANAAGTDKASAAPAGNAPTALPSTPPPPSEETPAEIARPGSQGGGAAPPASGAGVSAANATVSGRAGGAQQQGAAEPEGDGWVVQVAALGKPAEADAIVERLKSKGYAVYLLPPPPGGGMYRVRVGKFKERRDAETVMRRLQKEEHFKPWITR